MRPAEREAAPGPLAVDPIELTGDDLADFGTASRLEWIEANGVGGWASSTVAGVNTRRYHGLLVAAAHPPLGRIVLLSKLDEALEVAGARFELGCNQYPGTVHPSGYLYLRRFSRGIFPSFEYECGGVTLRKTVVGIQGENTTVVEYRVVSAPGPVVMELRPLLAGRDYHSLRRARQVPQASVRTPAATLRCGPWEGGQTLWVYVPGATFGPEADWHYDVEYLRELDRGLDFREDLWTPGTFRVPLAVGIPLRIVASTQRPERPAEEMLTAEVGRREAMLAALPLRDRVTVPLALAADQFIVRRGTDQRSVIAGYPWFGDWGRDTMIALPGLCLATGRFDDARAILRAWVGARSEGMLPNRFPDTGEAPEYNSVDATLWLFVAAGRYLEHTSDEDFVRAEILPALREAVDAYTAGTRYGIRQDGDGLLLAGEAGQQLTWMDARVGEWVVTPREGKAVEVNALWFNALRILADLEARLGDAAAATALAARARRTLHGFRRTFWYEEGGYLYDVVQGEGGDATLRPNQILALSLPHPLVSVRRARSVLGAVAPLLTPFGVRTLSSDHPDYRARYGGDQASRDAAYHQGTAWAWLLGPYLTALARWGGAGGRRRALTLLDGALRHLPEAGVGTFAELFDAEPPFDAGGTIAQAWSVAELLRCYVEDLRPRQAMPGARERGPGSR